jgi:Ni/Co efflux regulator RcnB
MGEPHTVAFFERKQVMKKLSSTISAVAGSLGLALACAMAVSTPAQAQPDGRYMQQRDGRGPDGYGPPGQRRQWDRDRDHDRRYDDRRRDYRHDHRPPPHVVVVPDRGRGVGPRNDWYRGGYVPAPYRGYSYVVGDWRMHRLTPPPRGYQWIQYGGDYVLIAIGTGLIANIVFNAY